MNTNTFDCRHFISYQSHNKTAKFIKIKKKWNNNDCEENSAAQLTGCVYERDKRFSQYRKSCKYLKLYPKCYKKKNSNNNKKN